MRKFVILLVIAAVIYGYVRYVPAETRHKALASIGLADFFQETLPNFLRERLSIPQNPVVKRQKLLDELTAAIGNIGRELEVVSPPVTNGAPVSTLPSPRAIQERIEKTRDFLAQSETALEELEKANPGQGILEKLTERLLDKILPPVGGDAGGGTAGGSVSSGGISGGGSGAGGGASECRCP